MSKVDKFAPGSFCWAEMGTKDVPAAKKFYGELLGWSFDDLPIGGGAFYTMARVESLEVCAMYTQRAEQKDAPAAKATAMGVKTIVAPMHIPGTGTFSVIADHQGAVFAIFTSERIMHAAS